MKPSQNRRFFLFVCLILALGTLALYWRVTGDPFTDLDDYDYIINNSMVKAGLTWPGIVWAFNGIHVANWHPLTWLSLMLDCQIFGVNPHGLHLVNVLFHIANTLLLFLLLRYTTGYQWRSAVVAALFAWHPLHVESVAWISERKDVLCGFFWLLSLLAYARYVRGSNPNDRPAKVSGTTSGTSASSHAAGFYGLALLSCAAALMSKPMAVTLPCVLLLMDLWPLNEWRMSRCNPAGSAA